MFACLELLILTKPDLPRLTRC
uniref:Uncharacterized protein n=1 Tax=Arundo donax TaxID=35708 RepID=A0A0A8ZA53_ARUDO